MRLLETVVHRPDILTKLDAAQSFIEVKCYSIKTEYVPANNGRRTMKENVGCFVTYANLATQVN